MEKPTIEEVLRVLDTLYRGENPSDKDTASAWLIKLHSSVHAWEIADQLLLLRRDVETSYFAAQTMQNKVRFSFEELPNNVHKDLRDSLMNHLQQLHDAPAPITRQLAMALADLALQMSGWNTVVMDLIERFKQDISTISVLLDVLIVLPEEINNRSLRLGQNRRKELREEFGRDTPVVLQLLDACLKQVGNTDIITRVYACMGSWIQLGSFPGDQLAGSTLMMAPFQTLKLLEVPPKLYEAASDCICSTLFMCEDSPSCYNLAQALQTEVQKLRPEFKAAVQSEDASRASSLCRIFTEMAETFLYHMVHQPDLGLGKLDILDLLLECVAHPDYEIADITFNVWYRLSEELLKLSDDTLYQVFKPYIERLISCLCVHCQLDEDTSPNKVTSDDSDDFTYFRKNVVELIRDVVFLVGSLQCFSQLYAIICKPGTSWNVTEACLFIMYAVAPSIRIDESELLPIAVPVLISIPPDCHCAIRATTLRLVGELSEWIDQHPDTLDSVLRFILSGFDVPAVATYAAKAVQSVCTKCKHRMAPHMTLLLQIIQAADNLSVSNEAVLGLLKGATEVLTKMPPNEMLTGIESLCTMYSTCLMQLNPGEAGTKGSISDPCVWLDRLAAIFRACALDLDANQTHPCSPLVERICPVICTTCFHFKENHHIVERSCRCIRFMIRCVRCGAAPVLPTVLEMCATLYRDHRHSCFLYLGSVVVDEFGTIPEYQTGLIGFLQALVAEALPILAAPAGMVENPDTVDDLFRLCARFLQRCPLLFLSSECAGPVSQCALAAATLNHRDAFSSVMKYFRDLIRLPKEMDESEQHLGSSIVATFLKDNGSLLLNALVTGFVSLPSVMIPDSTEVLYELIFFSREIVCQLLTQAVENISTGSDKVTVQQKSDFVSAAVYKCTSTEDLLPIIKDYARLYR